MSQQLAHELSQLRNAVNDLERKVERVDDQASRNREMLDRLANDILLFKQTLERALERLRMKGEPIGGKQGRRRTIKPGPDPDRQRLVELEAMKLDQRPDDELAGINSEISQLKDKIKRSKRVR